MIEQLSATDVDLEEDRHCLRREAVLASEMIEGVAEAVHAGEEVENESRSSLR
jgi:hypothetical protein